MRAWLLLLIAALLVACSSRSTVPAQTGWLPVHDDLGFSLQKSSKVTSPDPIDRYDVREVEEPLAGAQLRVRIVTKVLDEAERASWTAEPDAIGKIWPNALELRRTEVVAHVTDRAWEALDYDPSGLAHEDFEGGHSTYRTPARVTLNVAFVYKGTLVVLHASAEFDPPPPETSEQALIAKWKSTLEQVMQRLRRDQAASRAS